MMFILGFLLGIFGEFAMLLLIASAIQIDRNEEILNENEEKRK